MPQHDECITLAVIPAEEFVGALSTVDPVAWRRAALAAARDPGLPAALAALESALGQVERLRLWYLEDDMESALYRLTTHEAAGVVHGSREFQCIRATSWRATEALACATLEEGAKRVIAGPFLAIIARGSTTAPRDASHPPRPRA